MSRTRPLNPSQLGEAGENEFVRICTNGVPQLIVNKSTRDTVGWDYVVEFPHDNLQIGGLTSRTNPISTLFQQKTTWKENDRIKFRLSSLERLAKNPGPSFICVLKYSNDIVCEECYLIHLLDSNLEFVLKKLFELEISPSAKVSNKEIYINASKFGQKIRPLHQEMVAAIEQVVGPDINEYYVRKKAQLESLGCKPDRFTLSFTLSEEEELNLFDAMVGIKNEVSISNLKRVERRFDLERPLPMMAGAATLTVVPTSIGPCRLSFYTHGKALRGVAEAEMFTAPAELSYSPNPAIKRFVGKMVEILIRRLDWTITIRGLKNKNVKMPILEWVSHFRILKILSSPNAHIDIITPYETMRGQQITKTISAVSDEDLETYVKYTAMLAEILDHLGFDPRRELSFSQFMSRKQDIELVHGAICLDSIMAANPIYVSEEKADLVPEETRGSYMSYLDLGEEVLAFRFNVAAVREETKINVSFMRPLLEPHDLKFFGRDEYFQWVAEERNSLTRGPLLIASNPPAPLQELSTS